jgi:hypothetical protein
MNFIFSKGALMEADASILNHFKKCKTLERLQMNSKNRETLKSKSTKSLDYPKTPKTL